MKEEDAYQERAIKLYQSSLQIRSFMEVEFKYLGIDFANIKSMPMLAYMKSEQDSFFGWFWMVGYNNYLVFHFDHKNHFKFWSGNIQVEFPKENDDFRSYANCSGASGVIKKDQDGLLMVIIDSYDWSHQESDCWAVYQEEPSGLNGPDKVERLVRKKTKKQAVEA